MRGRRALAAVVLGIALEVAAFSLLDLSRFRDTLGLPGVVGIAIAIFAALYGGPVAGGVVAAAGWSVFFFTLADRDLDTLVVLPIWIATAIVVGVVAARQLEFERRRTDTLVDEIASHEFRTPVATIHGMAQALRSGLDLTDETRDHILDLIAEESKKLLDEEVMMRDRTQR